MTEERTLERETRIRGLVIPAGSTTGPDDFGIEWIKLASTARIHGHVFAAGTTLELASVLPALIHPALLLVYPWLLAGSLGARAREVVTVIPTEDHLDSRSLGLPDSQAHLITHHQPHARPLYQPHPLPDPRPLYQPHPLPDPRPLHQPHPRPLYQPHPLPDPRPLYQSHARPDPRPFHQPHARPDPRPLYQPHARPHGMRQTPPRRGRSVQFLHTTSRRRGRGGGGGGATTLAVPPSDASGAPRLGPESRPLQHRRTNLQRLSVLRHRGEQVLREQRVLHGLVRGATVRERGVSVGGRVG